MFRGQSETGHTNCQAAKIMCNDMILWFLLMSRPGNLHQDNAIKAIRLVREVRDIIWDIENEEEK